MTICSTPEPYCAVQTRRSHILPVWGEGNRTDFVGMRCEGVQGIPVRHAPEPYTVFPARNEAQAVL